MQEVAILQASATASRPSSCPLYTPSHSCQAVFWISRLLLLLVADADLSTYTSSMNEAYFVDKVVPVVVIDDGVTSAMTGQLRRVAIPASLNPQQVVWITGASSGIGEGKCQRRVAAHART